MRVTLTTLFIPLGFVMLASILAKKADNKKTEKVNGKKGSKTEKYTSSSGSNFRDRTNYKIKALEMHIDALKLEMAELRQSYFTKILVRVQGNEANVITLSREFQTISNKLLDLDPLSGFSEEKLANASNPFINFRNDMPSSPFALKDNFHDPKQPTIEELHVSILKLNETQQKHAGILEENTKTISRHSESMRKSAKDNQNLIRTTPPTNETIFKTIYGMGNRTLTTVTDRLRETSKNVQLYTVVV